MTLIALTSVSGAPGVTTTCLGLALAWPRPALLVEADNTGSSSIMAGYLRGQVAEPTSFVGGTPMSCLSDFEGSTIPLGQSTARLLPAGLSQVRGQQADAYWDELSVALQELDQDSDTDIIVDAGRLGTIDGPLPLVRAADQVLLVTATTLPAVAAVRIGAARLRDDLVADGEYGDRVLGLCLVGTGQPYGEVEISDLVATSTTATIASDPVAAEVLSLGSPSFAHFGSSAFNRSIHKLVATLRTAATSNVGSAYYTGELIQ